MLYASLLCVFLLSTSTLAYKMVTDDFFIPKCGDELIIEGRYLIEHGNTGKEFWICVDYESHVERNATDWLPYPSKQCGDKPYATKNLFWYAFHGIWEEDEYKDYQLKVFYESSSVFAYVEYNEHTMLPLEWSRNALRLYQYNPEQRLTFRLIQTHGTLYGLKRPNFDLIDLDYGTMSISSVADKSNIHVRVNGVGFEVTQIFEQKQIPKGVNSSQSNETMIQSNENATMSVCFE